MDNDLEKKICDFWENVQKECTPIQFVTGLTYYVFQTKYKFAPDLMIVGINPGDDYFGERFLVNRIIKTNWYTDWVNYQDVKGVSFNKRLCDLFDYQNDSQMRALLENSVGTNIMYFNSGNIDKLSKLKREITTIGCKYTRQLIDEIIKPKIILTMGNDPFYALKKSRDEIYKEGQISIKIAARNINGKSTPIINIPNPSPRNNKYYLPDRIADYQVALKKLLLNLT